jgi:hypothetical protein
LASYRPAIDKNFEETQRPAIFAFSNTPSFELNMGVKGLTKFLEQAGCFDALERAATQNSSSVPLVFDGSALLYTVWSYSMSWETGGSLREFESHLTAMMEGIKACGIDPVVVFDGAFPADKTETKKSVALI